MMKVRRSLSLIPRLMTPLKTPSLHKKRKGKRKVMKRKRKRIKMRSLSQTQTLRRSLPFLTMKKIKSPTKLPLRRSQPTRRP